jgi:hypothetical protein
MSLYSQRLRLYETSIIIKETGLASTKSSSFQVLTGSRANFALAITRIDPGATVTLIIDNGFSQDVPFKNVYNTPFTTVGNNSTSISDFQNNFNVQVQVTGGTADVALSVAIADNSGSVSMGSVTVDNAGIESRLDTLHTDNGNLLSAVSTAANQASANTILSNILAAVATTAKQDVGNASLSSIDGKTPALVAGKVPVDVTFPVTQPISGTVAVSNFPATQPVSGTFWQATQPISGAVTANVGTTGGLALDATVAAMKALLAGDTGAITSVASSITSVSLAAANANRKGMILYNDSASMAYVAFASSATTALYTVKMAPRGYFEMGLPIYRGAMSVIWDTADGSMKATEIT